MAGKQHQQFVFYFATHTRPHLRTLSATVCACAGDINKLHLRAAGFELPGNPRHVVSDASIHFLTDSG